MYQTSNYNFHVPDTPSSIFQQLKLMADDIDAALQTVDGGGGTGGGGYINPTTGYIPVRSSATSFADSLINDTGSSININGPVSITGGLTVNGQPIIPPTPHPVTSVFGRTGVIDSQLGDYPATKGGTGWGSYVIGDILFADSATTLARLADKATFFVLISGGIGVAPNWGKVNLNNAVTGLLPVTSGGTGTATVFTAGSVVFARAAGLYTENNANFFWDNTNLRLGLGTNAPASVLHTAVGVITMETSTASKFRIQTIAGVGQWSGISMNQLYTGGNWNLDDTTKEGFKISVISGTTVGAGGVTVDYIPPGPNPHTDGYGLVSIGRDSVALTMKPTVTVYLLDQWTGLQVPRTLVMTPLANNVLQTQNYTSGLVGWSVNAVGDAEFNNVSIRGELRTSVFKVNEIAATAGTFGVFYSASTLVYSCTTAGGVGMQFTFIAKNSDVTASAMLFGVGDIVRLKAYVNSGGVIIADVWATITSRTPSSTYTTYYATLNSGSPNVMFPAGTAVVDYGPSGTGFITLSTDGTVGATPNMTMATHAGSPWTAFTTATRVGNLNGSYGYTSNVYGFAAGQFGSVWAAANVVGGTFANGIFTKTAAAGWGNAGFSSATPLTGDCYIEWTATNPLDAIMVGLSYADTDQNYQTQNFSWYYPTTCQVYEGAAMPFDSGVAAIPGVTRFRIQRVGTTITYYKDGITVRSVACTSAPLYLDVAMYNIGRTSPPITMSNNLGGSWITVDPTNGVRIGANTVTTIQLKPDGSGFLASSVINWTAAGVMTIGGWVVGPNTISGTGIIMTSGANANITAGGATSLSANGIRTMSAPAFTPSCAYEIMDVNAPTVVLGALYDTTQFSTDHAFILQAMAAAGRNSNLLLLSDAPTGKNSYAQFGVTINGSSISYISMNNTTGIQFWTNGTKRMTIDHATASINIWGQNTVYYVPQDGTRLGMYFQNSAITAGCGSLTNRVTNGYNYVVLASNAPTGGSASHGLVQLTVQDNAAQQGMDFFMTGELSQGSRANMYPLFGTFRGFLISDVVVDGPPPFAGALFQLNSTTKGFLMPRMTIAQRNAIGAQNGTMVFNTDVQAFSFVCSGAWRDIPRGVLGRLSSTVNISCPNGATTLVGFNDRNLDPDGLWSIGFSSAFVISAVAGAGTYLIHGQVQMVAGSPAVGYSQLSVRKNRTAAGDVILGACTLQNTGQHTSMEVSTIATFNVGDYVELQFYTNCGATVTLAGASPQTPQFWITKLSSFSG